MQVSFNLLDPEERRRVRAMIDAEDGRAEAVQAPNETPPEGDASAQPAAPVTTAEGVTALKRLVRSKTGQKFLVPAVGHMPYQMRQTASQLDLLMGLSSGAAESYVRIIHKFCRKHPALKFTDLFSVTIGNPRRYAMQQGIGEQIRSLNAA